MPAREHCCGGPKGNYVELFTRPVGDGMVYVAGRLVRVRLRAER